MNKKLLEALKILEKEKNISKATVLEVIENSLLTACKNHLGRADNIRVNINAETCDFGVIAEREVVKEAEDLLMQISVAETKMMSPNYDMGGIVQIPIEPRFSSRIAARDAKNVVLQKIREEKRGSPYNDWYDREKDIVTGIVQRYLSKNLSISLGKMDAILNRVEQVKGEVFQPTERIKLYILEMEDTPKGSRISVFRTHSGLAKRLFESEVVEVHDDTVEIKAIVREAGSGTKIAMISRDANMDPVGARMGMNGVRASSIVNEPRGGKVDITAQDGNLAYLIGDALSLIKAICMMVDEDAKEVQVIVPNHQLSLATSKEGQNARLAARLTGYKIDTKSETQARESGLLEELGIRYQEEGVYEEYESGHDAEYQEDYQGDYQEEYQGDYQDDNVTE